MSNSNRPDSSLAFLDMLTCGLGGMLLLFFIVVALRQHVEAGGDSALDGIGQRTNSGIVFVSVRTMDGADLFRTGGNHFSLVRSGMPVEDWPDFIEASEGSSYANFYSPRGSLPDTSLFLQGVDEKASIEILVADRFGVHRQDWNATTNGLIYSFGSGMRPVTGGAPQ